MSVSSFFRSFFGEKDLVWVTTPTGWSVLLIMTFFNNWSVGAGAFVHYKKVTAKEALETLQEYPITKAQFRPSVYMRALDESDLKSFRFPSLKLCFVAGEPSNKQMLSRWKEQTGVELWDFYGQTETVCGCKSLARPGAGFMNSSYC